ncbi:MAG: hypothetical protein ACR5LF_14375 [Symbiopectobacterium sp.]
MKELGLVSCQQSKHRYYAVVGTMLPYRIILSASSPSHNHTWCGAAM